MGLKRKSFIMKICVVVIVVMIIVLFFCGMEKKAVSLLLISGGFLGFITRTIPFSTRSHITSFNENVLLMILGPIINAFAIMIGLMVLFD